MRRRTERNLVVPRDVHEQWRDLARALGQENLSIFGPPHGDKHVKAAPSKAQGNRTAHSAGGAGHDRVVLHPPSYVGGHALISPEH
jgi:hypothetical protein